MVHKATEALGRTLEVILKKLILTIIVLVFVACALFGIEKSWSYVRGGGRAVNQQVDARMPMSFESARIEELVAGKQREIEGQDAALAEIKCQITENERRTNDLRRRLGHEKELLAHVRTLLEQKRDQYVIGGRNYTFAQINADALRHIEDVRRLAEEIASNDALLQETRQQADAGRQTLASKRQELAQLQREFETLQVRNTVADMRLELSSLRDRLVSFNVGSGELEKAFLNYQRRVAVKEHQADDRLGREGAAGRIDYSAEVPAGDAISEINRVLRPASAPAVSAERRPAGQP